MKIHFLKFLALLVLGVPTNAEASCHASEASKPVLDSYADCVATSTVSESPSVEEDLVSTPACAESCSSFCKACCSSISLIPSTFRVRKAALICQAGQLPSSTFFNHHRPIPDEPPRS